MTRRARRSGERAWRAGWRAASVALGFAWGPGAAATLGSPGPPWPVADSAHAGGPPGVAVVLGPAAAADWLGLPQEPVVVGSKSFAESYVLAEVFALVLEDAGYAVDRRLGLGETELVFRALLAGEIDVYPEYTGTGLAAMLGEDALGGRTAVIRRVGLEFERRWGLRWLPPLGFENNYVMAVRPATADSLGLRALSDLRPVADELAAGLSPGFIGRADGLPGLEARGIRFGETRPLLQAVKYAALTEGEVHLIDAYSTDGAVARYDLATLRDDLGFFPPYDAAPLAGPGLYAARPAAAVALSRLAGWIDEETMRRANERVELDHMPAADAARLLLAESGFLAPSKSEGAETAAGSAAGESGGWWRRLPARLWHDRASLASQTGRHLLLVLGSLGAAILVAVPAGLGLERRRAWAEAALRAASLLQTIPGIALLAFMIPVFGIGAAPATAALFLYSLLPILRNTYAGLIGAAPDAVGAGRALGMTEGQLLTRIRLPLAAPVIMAGIRTAAVINVGTATLAAFVGAGGLGDPIVAGLALRDSTMILSGAAPAAALALAVDYGLARAERRVAPKGVRPR